MMTAGLERRPLSSIEFRGPLQHFEMVKEALQLLADYTPAARTRVERRVREVVSVEISSYFQDDIGVAYLNFDDFDSPFLVAFWLLLQATSVHVRERHLKLGQARWSVMRESVNSPRHFMAWWMIATDCSEDEGHSLFAWTQSLITDDDRGRWHFVKETLREIWTAIRS